MKELLEIGIIPFSKAGDRRKPLEKYNPNASRNKLPDEPYFYPKFNESHFSIGTSSVDPRHYVTTNEN